MEKFGLLQPDFHLVLDSDGSSIDDSDVLEAIIAEGHALVLLREGQLWQSQCAENINQQVKLNM